MEYEEAKEKWTRARDLRELKMVEFEEIIEAYAGHITELEAAQQSKDTCPGCGKNYTGLCGNCSRENTMAILRP